MLQATFRSIPHSCLVRQNLGFCFQEVPTFPTGVQGLRRLVLPLAGWVLPPTVCAISTVCRGLDLDRVPGIS